VVSIKIKKKLEEEKKDILKEVHMSKVILPILIGIIVLGYMVFKQFNWEEFNKIEWGVHTYFWIGMALLLYIIRHFFISARLRLLSDFEFSWKKTIELIFIWEFSSSVSPTSFGGSAVALFFLSHEKLKTSKSITLVLYTIVLDSFFFLLSLPILILVLGPIVFRPGLTSFWQGNEHAYLFVLVYIGMLTYSGFFFYGLFLHPENMKKTLHWLSNLKLLKRFKGKLFETGNNIVIASQELSHKNIKYHLKAFLYTGVAWSLRFLVINMLIIAFSSVSIFDIADQLIIYGRSQNLYVETSFTPTPGSTGFAEYLFNGFFHDYTPAGISLVIAIIWRIITYYTYLFAGIIIVPNWINRLLSKGK